MWGSLRQEGEVVGIEGIDIGGYFRIFDLEKMTRLFDFGQGGRNLFSGGGFGLRLGTNPEDPGC